MNQDIKDLRFRIDELRKSALREFQEGKDVRDTYLGRGDGEITKILRQLKDFPVDVRKEIGPLAQALKQELEAKLQRKERPRAVKDFTLPGVSQPEGHLNPLTLTIRRLAEIFTSMNFSLYEGPELDTDFYNFTSLNVPKDHPARDMQDTFFSEDGRVLRTQTSNMQVRIMQEQKPPLRVGVMGRAYRAEATDARHGHTFHQVEAFAVDRNITLANLKCFIRDVLSSFFERDLEIRLRPGYFPFVEPGMEVDCTCLCGGKKKQCALCKGSGWLEMGGCGMIHPNVFKAAGYKAGEYTGFALGFGIERFAMLSYGINDTRLFLSGDLGFLKQF